MRTQPPRRLCRTRKLTAFDERFSFFHHCLGKAAFGNFFYIFSSIDKGGAGFLEVYTVASYASNSSEKFPKTPFVVIVICSNVLLKFLEKTPLLTF